MGLERFVSWTDELVEAGDEPLWMLYHENSKLGFDNPTPIAGYGGSGYELFVSSRGFKQFRQLPRVSLPDVEEPSPLGRVMAGRRSSRDLGRALSFAHLATVIQQSLGPSALVRQQDHDIVQALRAWPSAGGLYPIDTYVVAAQVSGLPPGTYHYNVLTAELERLPGDQAPRDVMGEGFFAQDFAVDAAVGVLFVAAFDRTVTKYAERGYRLTLLDAGHAAQNVLLTAEDLGLPAVPVAGFCDDALAGSLDLDGMHEAVVHAVLIGGGDDGEVA
jgi:SagB-type dehydrogenase family enzyme